MLALQIDGRSATDVTEVSAQVVTPSTLDGFINHAATMFDSGEGLR